MQCTKNPDRPAAGVCSFSGKPYSAEELVEVNGKLVGKENVGFMMKQLEESMSRSSHQAPMVFMNAGGGGGAAASSSAAAVAAPVAPMAAVSIKSKSTAGILALLLGGLGAHKFYLGKPVQGILYLLFVWTFVPSIIALFEGISYLTMSELRFAQKFG